LFHAGKKVLGQKKFMVWKQLKKKKLMTGGNYCWVRMQSLRQRMQKFGNMVFNFVEIWQRSMILTSKNSYFKKVLF
jgi:hypothetical protein